MSTPYGPCDSWPVRWSCDVSCESPTVTAQATQFATETIWALSGRQFGLCTVTLRPCRRDCADDSYWLGRNDFGLPSGSWPTPALIGGEWFNLTCGGCVGGCSCSVVSEVQLPAPVHRVVSVQIDGTPLVTGAYRLDDARLLVRTDGGEWPICNDLSRNDGEEGTWSVTAEYGLPVPEGGAWAVGELACQFIRARNGEDCSLPQAVQTLARQGVTISYPSPYEWYRHGLTGLYLVDTFVRAWNPDGLTRRSRVVSVDGTLGRRAT